MTTPTAYCAACHYPLDKRFSRCPECGSRGTISVGGISRRQRFRLTLASISLATAAIILTVFSPAVTPVAFTPTGIGRTVLIFFEDLPRNAEEKPVVVAGLISAVCLSAFGAYLLLRELIRPSPLIRK